MTAATSFRLTPMRPRDPGEPGRTATPLELFFDLVFVVAVSIAAGELHHALSDDLAVPLGALLVLLDPITGVPVLLTAVIMVAVVAVLVLRPPLSERQKLTGPAQAGHQPALRRTTI
ncbi:MULTISPECIES: low temperature requirement protein A [unclassified Actinoplanes]|uniref:low temperature requirement protein A n=1 Tax=unclassified Actinoplanes TaxID=2626549 RepID=UPI0009AFBB79|nr:MULTISPECIES: low temperature requirement protein A [unclassified Actinoplanes]